MIDDHMKYESISSEIYTKDLPLRQLIFIWDNQIVIGRNLRKSI